MRGGARWRGGCSPRALETPGGLKVQTIHAFCTQLLHQFPFEANVAARFSVLDDAEQSQLLEQLTLGVLLEGAGDPGSALGRALDAAMTAAADRTFRDVVREAIGQRDAISRWVQSAGGVDDGDRELGARRSASIRRTASRKSRRSFFRASIIAAVGVGRRWRRPWPGAARPTASRPSALRDCRRLPDRSSVETYLDIFCTDRRQRTDAAQNHHHEGCQAIRHWRSACSTSRQRVWELLERRRGVALRDRSAALVTVAYEVMTRYANEKERRGLLDYDDLIDKTLQLLANVDAAWVHFKLDLGIDHVLIDEAQDTSHKQWEIVRRLTAEFTAGAGARGLKRTMFAVGDEKQSIYSFQNAAPKEFAEMRRHFKTRARDERAEIRRQQVRAFVPLRRGDSRRGGRGVQARGHRAERHLRSGRISAAHRACRTRRRAWSKSGSRRSRTNARRSKAGTRRSIP